MANWLAAHAVQLPPAPVPTEVETIELDELFTFVARKKDGLPHSVIASNFLVGSKHIAMGFVGAVHELPDVTGVSR